MRDRNRQRELKKADKREEELNLKTEWGIKDLTPLNCVRQMNGKTILYK